MLSDTHCHLSHISERGVDLSKLLSDMRSSSFSFVLDIGTKPGDFVPRLNRISEALQKEALQRGTEKNGEGEAAQSDFPEWLHFSCGLWPDASVIADRENAMKILERDAASMLDHAYSNAGPKRAYAALGECGLDRYWNGPDSPGRKNSSAENADDGPGTDDLSGEEALFEMQLEVSRKLDLPVVVHSRDAFEQTLGCIKNMDYDRGVIHCFAYGIAEARAFLDRGWHISFPGNITWAKKAADRERIAALLRYVPTDRLLLETDAPYLAPAPHRGAVNTPLLIRHTFERAAECLGLGVNELTLLVETNAKELFALKVEEEGAQVAGS